MGILSVKTICNKTAMADQSEPAAPAAAKPTWATSVFGPLVDGVSSTIKGLLNWRELPKAERHAQKRGMDLPTYMAHKYGEKAAERGRKKDLAQYLAIHQARRRCLYGEGGKCKDNRCGDSSDSSSDSE